MQNSTFIGLDVHKATISVAIAQGERGGEVLHFGTVPHRPDQVRKLVEKLASGGARLHFCYEAGPCGYGLHRQIVEMGHDCIVVAPSLIPVKSGDRVKTDRRDALMLAKLHRAGELTAVWVPDAAHEAMRDLVRARATAMRVAGKARQHLQGFLLRHSRIYPGKKGWTGTYRRWLAMVRFTHPAQQIVLLATAYVATASLYWIGLDQCFRTMRRDLPVLFSVRGALVLYLVSRTGQLRMRLCASVMCRTLL